MGEWECLECRHKFRIEKKETLSREKITSTVPEIPKEEREKKDKITSLLTTKQRSTKWLTISVVLLFAGLLSGYTLGTVFMQAGEIITKTIFIPQTIEITKTHTETQATTQTVTITSTVAVEKQIPAEEQFQLKIIETIVDTVSEVEYNYYIMMLEAMYSGGKSWKFNFLFISLLSNTGYKYSILLPISLRTPLGAEELENGEKVRGQVAFKLPKNETPLKLRYDDELNGIFLELTDIPKPRGEVSYIYFVETEVRSDYSFIWASGSKKTPGIIFYSGEDVEIELEVEYSRFLNNPQVITITAITVESFEIIKIEPKMPLNVNDKEKVKIELVLRVPEKGYRGNLKITITT